MESREADESFLDEEEIERIKEELQRVQNEKKKHIQRMQARLEQSEALTSDTESNEAARRSREPARNLVEGFQKVKERYRFNIEHIEEKYKAREESGCPESRVEMDIHGNVYFPETMSAARQQTFVNRMFQNWMTLGKGSVSAPRNSISSFDGDNRALKKSKQLDDQFRRKLRNSYDNVFEDDYYGNGRRGTIISSSHVSGIPLRRRSPFSSSKSTAPIKSRHYRSRFSESLEDNVFRSPERHSRYEDRPTTSNAAKFEFSDDEESEEEATDDESSGSDEDEVLTDEEDEEVENSSNLIRKPLKMEIPSPKIQKISLFTLSYTPGLPRNGIKLEFPQIPAKLEISTPKPLISSSLAEPENKENTKPNSPYSLRKRAVDSSKKPGKSDSPAVSSPSITTPVPTRPTRLRKSAGKPEDNGTEKCQNKAPYCKHCELLKEEKKKAKLEAKNIPSTSGTPVVAQTVVQKPAKKSEKVTPKCQSKRRSETVAATEPVTKKQKLSDSDIISIPSSMAVAVDTELIAAENSTLTAKNLPKFAENSPEASVWSSSIDQTWIQEVKNARGARKDPRFFGVPAKEYPKDTPMINFWVDNLRWNKNEKDPFDTDFRRSLAQDKKARHDVKAGYGVRR